MVNAISISYYRVSKKREGFPERGRANTWLCGQGSSTLWPRSTVTLAWSGEPPVGKARQRRSRWGSRCLPAERRCLLASSSTPSSILLSTPFPHSFRIRLTSQEVMILVSHLCNQNLIILTVDRNLQSKINIRCGGAKIGGH